MRCWSLQRIGLVLLSRHAPWLHHLTQICRRASHSGQDGTGIQEAVVHTEVRRRQAGATKRDLMSTSPCLVLVLTSHFVMRLVKSVMCQTHVKHRSSSIAAPSQQQAKQWSELRSHASADLVTVS